MKRPFLIFLFLFLFLLAYLMLYPVPIDPAAWQAPSAPVLGGVYAANNDLGKVRRLFEDQCIECEDVAIDNFGRIYGGSIDGRILRFDSVGDETGDVFAVTGGRPLGLQFDRSGRLIVADAYRGLLSINPAGEVSILADGHGGRRFGLTDDLDIGSDGTIYFTDASWKFPSEQYRLDLLEHRPNGRLLAYHPKNKQTELLLDSLYFANGVAVAEDQSFVLVCETGRYQVRRYWLEGPKAGRSDILIDNLPGFPDGISRGSGGIFWVALASPRNPNLDQLLSYPILRKILLRLPSSVQPAPEHMGFILGIDAEGEVVYNLQDSGGRYAQITNVREHKGALYLGSLYESSIGWLARPGPGVRLGNSY